MNIKVGNLNDSLIKTVNKSCYRCGYIRETSDKKCPECGSILESAARIRLTGAVQIVLGSGLLAFMSWLAFWMLNANSKNHFHGGEGDILFIGFIFALVGSISLGTLTAGFWQIVFGKRNKILMFGMIIPGIAFIAAGFGVFLSK